MKINLYYQFKPKTAFIIISGFLITTFSLMLTLGLWSAWNEPTDWRSPLHASVTVGCVIIPAGYLFYVIKTTTEKLLVKTNQNKNK